MKLLMRRDQRAAGMLGGKTMFVLEVRAQLSDDERTAIKRCNLNDLVLFNRLPKRLVEHDGHDKWMNFLADMMDVEILVRDLVEGRKFECKDIQEMMRAERSIRKAAEHFDLILWRALNFAGEEVCEFQSNAEKWEAWVTRVELV